MENKRHDSSKMKILIFILSIVVTAVVVFLFFLDNSLQWNLFKILSCIVANLWVFFLIPAFRKSYLTNIDKPMDEWIKIGYRYGVSRIAYPILFAPYYGVKYYCTIKK